MAALQTIAQMEGEDGKEHLESGRRHCDDCICLWRKSTGCRQESQSYARRSNTDWALLPGDPSGQTLYLSGQIAIDTATNQFLSNGSIEDQTRRVLDNLAAVLAADGLTMDHIVSTTVFLKDVNDFAKMNEIYATYFKNAPPARATVEVARLPRDAKIEISAIAVAR